MPPSRAIGDSTLSSEFADGVHKGSFGESSSFLGGVGLTWDRAAAVVTTFCISSSTSLLPFSFGRMGYLGAPVVMLLYFGLAFFVQLKLLEIAAGNSHVHNVADVGQLLGGRWGRRVLAHCCLWNQQFFLPVAVVLTSRTLQFISWGWFADPMTSKYDHSCHGLWMVSILIIFVIGTNLTRNFGAAAQLSKISLVTNTLQVFFIIMNLNKWKNDPAWLTTTKPYAWPPSPSEWNGNYTCTSTNETKGTLCPEDHRGNLGYLLIAVTNIGYTYCPCFVSVEVMAEMDNRHEMAKVLKFSTCFLIILYLTVGVGSTLTLGWEMSYSMAQDLVWDRWGIAANVTLCYACILDYMIAAVTVNKWVQLKINPDFDDADWSAKAVFQWFMYTSPSTILCFAMCLLIPKLESLTGLLTAVIIPVCQIICPACLLLRGDRYGLTTTALSTPERILLLCSVAYGVVLLLIGTMSTGYTLSFLSFTENYWCVEIG